MVPSTPFDDAAGVVGVAAHAADADEQGDVQVLSRSASTHHYAVTRSRSLHPAAHHVVVVAVRRVLVDLVKETGQSRVSNRNLP